MPVCDICSEELSCDSELKTHLLLSHLENEGTCPLCSLSGVSCEELNIHVNTAHREKASGPTPATVEPRHPVHKLETGADLSSVSQYAETQNRVKRLSHRPAGETSSPNENSEKIKENKIMKPLALKHRRLSSPTKGDV